MTFPAYPQQQPQYPPQQQPQYPPQQQPQYPPQQQPQYPPQQQPQYPPQQQPQYPPQQYQQPQGPPQPAAARGTIDDFYGQRTGAGKSISFADKQPGYRISGIVARPVTNADIQQQTDIHGNLQFFRDKRPKFEMVVPLSVAPSPEHNEGKAAWYVKGQARDELSRAMAEAGAPDGPPQSGARIDILFAGKRPIPGMSAQNIVQIGYTLPEHVNGSAAPAPVAPQPPQQPVQQAPFPQTEQVTGQFLDPNAYPQPQQPQYAPQPQQPVPPSALSQEHQQLLRDLTGGS